MRHNGQVSEPTELTYRLGGPVGDRALRTGRWFDPTLWALLAAMVSWLVVMARQVPCRPLPGDFFPNAFLRLCYSDIPTLYLSRDISTGAGLYSQTAFEYPVLTGYFVEVARAITRLLGGQVSATASYEAQVAASQLFFQVCAVGLFCCFAVTIVVHLKLERRNPSAVLLIAASPVVMANGLINWDLLAVMLTSIGLLVWSRKYPLIAGGVLGLAFAAKFYPILVLIAITMVCVRANRFRALTQLWAGAVVCWVAVNLPVMLTAWSGWSQFWTMNADRGADLGSIWYVFTLIGLPIPGVSAVAFSFMAACGFGLCWLTLTAPRRPRLAQLALLLLMAFLIFNKVYSPQYALWLLPLVVLARPRLPDVAIWTLGEIIYYVCIWGFLEGLLGPGSGSEPIYWAAVIVRISIQLWFSLRVIDDIQNPWLDPVRKPMVDDPQGGPVNHTPDAAWLGALRPSR